MKKLKSNQRKLQNGGVSVNRYKSNSPDQFNNFNMIPSNRITMSGVKKKLLLLPIDNEGNHGNPVIAKPGDSDFYFPDHTHVLELPYEEPKFKNLPGIKSKERQYMSNSLKSNGELPKSLNKVANKGTYKTGGLVNPNKKEVSRLNSNPGFYAMQHKQQGGKINRTFQDISPDSIPKYPNLSKLKLKDKGYDTTYEIDPNTGKPTGIGGLESAYPELLFFPAAKGLGTIGNFAADMLTGSMRTGTLSNTYKLNPWRFKPNPEAGYRMLGEKGYIDALNSGEIRPMPGSVHKVAHFNIGSPLDIHTANISGFEGPYMAEQKYGTWQGFKDLGWVTDTHFKNDVWSHPYVGNIKLDDPRLTLYKQHWLQGYKKVPKKFQQGGDTLSIQDNRLIDAVTKKLRQKGQSIGTTGPASRKVIEEIIRQSYLQGVSPFDALAHSLQETGIGTRGEGDALYHLNPTLKGTPWYSQPFTSDPRLGVESVKYQQDYANRFLKRHHYLPYTDEMLQQGYSGYGKIPLGHPDLEGATSFEGVPIPKKGLNMLKNPIQGRRVVDIRENIIKKNPEIIKIANQYAPSQNKRRVVGQYLPVDPSQLEWGGSYQGDYNVEFPNSPVKQTGGEPSKEKAAEILKDNSAHGHKLTRKQQKYFGYLANKELGGQSMYNINNPYMGFGGVPCHECESNMAKGGHPNFEPGNLFEEKKNNFLNWLKSTSMDALHNDLHNEHQQFMGEMLGSDNQGDMHQMPDGTWMANSEMKKGGNWIKGAVNPKHKGYCTPMTKKTCTPRRKAFARTMKKHHGFHEEGGSVIPDQYYYNEGGYDDGGEYQMGGDYYDTPLDQMGNIKAHKSQDYYDTPLSQMSNIKAHTQPQSYYDIPLSQMTNIPAHKPFPSPISNYDLPIDQMSNIKTHLPKYDYYNTPLDQMQNIKAHKQLKKGGGLSREEDYGSKSRPYPSVSSEDFAGPHRSYPIPTKADAVDALRLAGLHGRYDIRAKVLAKYPELKKEYGGSYKKGGNWIQSAVKHPGRCTPGSPNYDCPKGSPQWNLAQTFKKHHGFHKKESGGELPEWLYEARGRAIERSKDDYSYGGYYQDGSQVGPPYAEGYYGPQGFDNTYDRTTNMAIAPQLGLQQFPVDMTNKRGINPIDKFTMGKKKPSFLDRISGPQNVEAGLAGIEGLTYLFNTDERRNREKFLKNRTQADKLFASDPTRNRGDYSANEGYFRADQMTPTQFTGASGMGSYKKGGEYYMNDDEIQRIIAQGGEIEYINE